MSSVNGYNKEFYKKNQKDIRSAEKILPYVIESLASQSIVDFGCGSGTWLYEASKLGVKNILGIDGEYLDSDWLLIDKKDFLAADLTRKIDLSQKYDLAICLEVAEHIYEEQSDKFLKNLTDAADIILFSAASPFQGGTHHVNEELASYWVEKFKKYGFVVHDGLRWKFWNDTNVAFWYRQNIMFFVKENKLDFIKEKFPITDFPIDIIHPEQNQKNYLELNNEIIKLKSENTKYNDEISKLKLELNSEKKEISTNPKVSVVVPVFNVKRYLKECLDSIINQSLQDIEILCGDGGSNDGSLEILKEYEKKDKRIKVISREGSGYGQSVNECMDLARGEYIGIVESDDRIKSNMYETLYKKAKQYDLDWIRSDIYLYYSDNQDNQLVRDSITYGKNIYNKVWNPQTNIEPYKTGLRSWSGIYKKDFLNKYQIRHHETPGGSYQDVGFYLRTLYDAERVYFLDQAFYMWRQDNPQSSIHYNSKKLIDKSLYEWNLSKQYLMLRSDATKRHWGSYNYRRFFSYLWTIDLANDEDKKEVIKFAQDEFKEAFKNNQIDRAFFDEYEWKLFKDFIKNRI